MAVIHPAGPERAPRATDEGADDVQQPADDAPSGDDDGPQRFEASLRRRRRRGGRGRSSGRHHRLAPRHGAREPGNSGADVPRGRWGRARWGSGRCRRLGIDRWRFASRFLPGRFRGCGCRRGGGRGRCGGAFGSGGDWRRLGRRDLQRCSRGWSRSISTGPFTRGDGRGGRRGGRGWRPGDRRRNTPGRRGRCEDAGCVVVVPGRRPLRRHGHGGCAVGEVLRDLAFEFGGIDHCRRADRLPPVGGQRRSTRGNLSRRPRRRRLFSRLCPRRARDAEQRE